MKYDAQPVESNTPAEPERTPLEARVEALESRLAFQEDWLETLDRRLYEHTAEIERLTRLNSLMRERLREQRQAIDDLGDDSPEPRDELPPHY